MKHVSLQARDGMLMTFVKIPETTSDPEAIVWNNSVFVRAHGATPPAGSSAVYREAFTLWSAFHSGPTRKD